MEYNYSITVADFDQASKSSTLLKTNAALIQHAQDIDKMILASANLEKRYFLAIGSATNIRIDNPNSGSIQNDEFVINCLCSCKTILFEQLDNLKNHNDFKYLCRKINQKINTLDKNLNRTLCPTSKLNEFRFAKLIVKLSELSALRQQGPSFVYADEHGQVTIRCSQVLKIADLLPAKPEDPTEYKMRLGIKYAPISAADKFVLLMDGHQIEYTLLDQSFLKKWDERQLSIKCHDALEVTASLYPAEASDNYAYKITAIHNIVPGRVETQETFSDI